MCVSVCGFVLERNHRIVVLSMCKVFFVLVFLLVTLFWFIEVDYRIEST